MNSLLACQVNGTEMASEIDSEYWRKRAQEIRALAETMRYQESREKMLRIAGECDALAKQPASPLLTGTP